jgi:membrane protease YdiL (CAAX protease family)
VTEQRAGLIVALVALLLIATAEALTTWVDARLGVGLHVALVVGLFVTAGLVPAGATRRLAVALTLVPLMRVMGLMMPLAVFPVAQRYVLVMAPMLLAVPLYVYYQGMALDQVGLSLGRRGALAAYLPVALVGLPFGILEATILHPAPFAVVGLSGGVSVVVLALAVGFMEELILRGVLLAAAASVLGDWAGIVFVALVYAALQTGYQSWPHAALSLVVSVFFGWVVARVRSVYPVSLAHGFANMIIFGLRPL